uniref:Uncharacterized protein n=1 Tax=Caenorhabditis tropicalis TaxID=1561998 RepID=A0A1I7TNY3_9PELO
MVGRIAVPRIKFADFLLLIGLIFCLISVINGVSHEEENGSEEVPRGIYHFSDTDRDIETSFKIPDFEALDPIRVASELMSSAMKVDTKRKTLAGIQMPFSLTGRPMNLQINGESHDAVSLVDDPKKRKEKKEEVRRSDMNPESRRAFLRARQVCLEQSADSCDEALDTFHRVRYGKSLLIGGEGDGENENFRNIIERRLKETEKLSSPSTSSEDSTSSNPFTTSESHEEEEDQNEEEEEEEEERKRIESTTKSTSNHRFLISHYQNIMTKQTVF